MLVAVVKLFLDHGELSDFTKAVIVIPRHDSALRINAAYISFNTARSPKACPQPRVGRAITSLK